MEAGLHILAALSLLTALLLFVIAAINAADTLS